MPFHAVSRKLNTNKMHSVIDRLALNGACGVCVCVRVCTAWSDTHACAIVANLVSIRRNAANEFALAGGTHPFDMIPILMFAHACIQFAFQYLPYRLISKHNFFFCNTIQFCVYCDAQREKNNSKLCANRSDEKKIERKVFVCIYWCIFCVNATQSTE